MFQSSVQSPTPSTRPAAATHAATGSGIDPEVGPLPVDGGFTFTPALDPARFGGVPTIPESALSGSPPAGEAVAGVGVSDRPEQGPTGVLSLDTVLSPFVIVFCVAFAVAYVFTPIMRMVAVAYGIVDQPDRERKIHSKPVAYLGGVAVFLGFVSALAICQIFAENYHPALRATGALVKIPIAFVAGTCVIFALGLLDDTRGVRPKLKILGQVAGAVTLLAFGLGDDIMNEFVTAASSWLHVNLGILIPGVVERAVGTAASYGFVIALVVFCCNASNLMDGLDGLCGGITAIIAFGLIIVSAHLAMTGPVERAGADAARLAIAIALFGAVLGFLPFNFNPASIFMGDTGSLLMGYVVAVVIILLGEAGTKWMMGGLVMFSLPVLDTALAFARRYVNKRPFFSADRHHFHHQLVARGLTVRRAVILSYALTIFFVASGAMLVFLRTRYAVAFYMVLFGCIIVAAYKMGMVHERRGRLAESLDSEAEMELPGAPQGLSSGSVAAGEPQGSGGDAGEPSGASGVQPREPAEVAVAR